MLPCLDSPSPSPSLHSMQTWHWGHSQKPPETSWKLLKLLPGLCWRLRGLHTADLQPPGSTWQAALGGIVGLTKVGHQYFFLTCFFLPPSQLTWHWVTQTDLLLLTAAIMRCGRGRGIRLRAERSIKVLHKQTCVTGFYCFFFASVTHMPNKCIRIAGLNAVPRFHVGVTDTLPCLIQIEKSYCDAPANRNAIR